MRTVLASFLFVDVVGFSKVSASEQHAFKVALIDVLQRNLSILAWEDYRLRDTGDGALISFLTNPEHALYMAQAIAQDCRETGERQTLTMKNLRTGINLGTVKESLDVESRPNFVGDGINAAQRIMDFAQPGQVTSSRSFMDAVALLDPDYAALFFDLGMRADKHGRQHELFSVTPDENVLENLRRSLAVAQPLDLDLNLDFGAPAASPSPAPFLPSQTSAAPAASSLFPDSASLPTPAPRRAASRLRWGFVAALVGVLVAIALAALLRALNTEPVPAMSVAPAATVAAPASAQAPAPTTPAPTAAQVPATVPVPTAPAPSSPPVSMPAATPVPSTPDVPAEPAPRKAQAPAPARPARQPAAPPEPRPAQAQEPSPPAVAAKPDRASPRCSRIMQKAGVGEPLSAEEKKELANSC